MESTLEESPKKERKVKSTNDGSSFRRMMRLSRRDRIKNEEMKILIRIDDIFIRDIKEK